MFCFLTINKNLKNAKSFFVYEYVFYKLSNTFDKFHLYFYYNTL